MGYQLAWTFFLVLLNGFFVAAEFAIVKIRSSQIELKLRKGHRLARVAKDIHNNLDAYLSAIQLGITVASLGLGWIGEKTMARLLIGVCRGLHITMIEPIVHQLAFPLAFLIIMVLHIVLGELVPKSLAIQHPVAITFFVVGPLRLFYRMFIPLIWMLNRCASFVLKRFGIRNKPFGNSHSTDEIKILLEEGKASGMLQSSEHDIIQNVLYASNKTVKQIMVPHLQIEAVSLASSCDKVVKKFIQDGYTRLPVYKESLENIVGILYAKDFLKGLIQTQFNWKDNIQKPYFVPESKKMIQLLGEFQTEHHHMAIVLDEFGSTAGLVTFEDILEELVGDIQDEYDTELPLIEAMENQVLRVNTSVAISTLNESLPDPLPEHANYDTLAGFLNTLSHRIPQPGDKLRWGPYEFQVIKGNKRRAEWVYVHMQGRHGS